VTNRQTDTQTDRPRYFVCSNRPHLAIAAMRPNNAATTVVGGLVITALHTQNVGT